MVTLPPSPTLPGSEEYCRLLADNTSDMILLLSIEDGRILEANRAALEAYGCTRAEYLQLTIHDIRHPSTWADLPSQISTAEQTNTHYETLHVRKTGEVYLVEVEACAVKVDGRKVLLNICRDISERRRVEEQLKQQIAENARLLKHTRRRNLELETLATISTMLRRIGSYADMIAQMPATFSEVVGSQACSLMLLEGDTLVVLAAAGAAEGLVGIRLHSGPDPLWDALRTGSPLIQSDSSEEDEETPSSSPPEASSEPGCKDLFRILTAGLRSYAFIPIKVSEASMGAVFFGYQTRYTSLQENFNLMSALAEIAGNTIYRNRMHERLERLVDNRTKDLETIYNITLVASQSGDLNKALEWALDQALPVLNGVAGMVFFLDESGEWVDLVAQRGVPSTALDRVSHRPVSDTLAGWVIKHDAPLLIPDLTKDQRAEAMRHALPHVYSYLGVPMHAHGRTVGTLVVVASVLHEFSIDEITLMGSIADHLGLALENARLRHEAEAAAVMQERSRLARDLHDSVTQLLYSLTLYADAGLNMANCGDLDQAKDYLQKLGQISQQALREMRVLVYELRPPTLDQDGLVGALQQRLDAVEGRSGVTAQLSAAGLPTLPMNVEESLYRIALEALNNVIKHSGASEVKVELAMDGGSVRLTVGDNGRGVNPAIVQARAGFGMDSMRERAQKCNGTFVFTSHEGQGSSVVVTIPIEQPAGS
jgi:PAS domain S-box-containing protein